MESIWLKNRLCSIDFNISGKINHERLASSYFDPKCIEGLELSPLFMIPFALFFNDGEMALFWANTPEDIAMWWRVFQTLL